MAARVPSDGFLCARRLRYRSTRTVCPYIVIYIARAAATTTGAAAAAAAADDDDDATAAIMQTVTTLRPHYTSTLTGVNLHYRYLFRLEIAIETDNKTCQDAQHWTDRLTLSLTG